MTQPTTVGITDLGRIVYELMRAERLHEVEPLLAAHRGLVLAEAAEHLERIADETEAQVAAHYGLASGIGPGSADMVREAARTVRSLAVRTTQES